MIADQEVVGIGSIRVGIGRGAQDYGDREKGRRGYANEVAPNMPA